MALLIVPLNGQSRTMKTTPGKREQFLWPSGNAVRGAWSDGIDRLAAPFARVALAAAFLSGIASRFGWWGKGVGYGNYARFVAATAEVNAFMPAWTIPFLAAAATAAELVLGLLLLTAVRPRATALASAGLLLLFGTAMAISAGLKSPLDYSVFSAAGAALLLARRATPGQTAPSPRSSSHRSATSPVAEVD